MHARKGWPVTWRVVIATALFQVEGSGVTVNGTGVAYVNVEAHRTPAMDLMVELCVRAAEVRGVADYGDGVDVNLV